MVLVFFLVGGCGETSFLGRQYDNFTAYYNKFYNAQKAFEDGVESVEQTNQPVDRTTYISVFVEPEGGTNESSFEEVVQKSADVLREHPNSKWVDDALLLIGKSYFYQENYVGAAQKFREVLAMEGERRHETRFWLSRTLVTDGSFSDATEVLLADEESEEEPADSWRARMSLVRGDLLVRQEEWSEAERALERGLSGDLPDEAAARGAFLLGQVRETRGAPDEARNAYRRAYEYDPAYELAFAAQLSDIELQGEVGDATEALDRLSQLEQDDKNREKRGEMALVRARIYRAQGDHDRARDILRDMLYGEERPSSSSAGRIQYDLATLYRDFYKDFSRAAAHFDTASTSLESSSSGNRNTDRRRLPAAPIDASSEADRYRNLAEHSREIARLDSLLRVGRMDEAEFEAFVDDLRQRRAEEASLEETQAGAGNRRLQRRGQGLEQQREEGAQAVDTRGSDAGFLFHNDPARVQQGERRFQETWGDRPRVDNWRRRTAMRAADSSSDEEESQQVAPDDVVADDAARTGGGQDASAVLDLSDVPRDSSSQAEMEGERAVVRYELANSLFLAAGRPDSAATWYRRILQENGDHPVARQALYALAEAYRAMGDTTAARQSYRRLVDQYPGTELAERGRERLDQQEEEPVDNRSARADSVYARAYDQWQKGAWRPALDSMFSVAHMYPNTEAAPRALLAAGIIYWQRAQRDSTQGLPVLMRRRVEALRRPDSLRRNHPSPVPPEFRLPRVGSDSSQGTPDWVSLAPLMHDSLRRAVVDSVDADRRGDPATPARGADSLDTTRPETAEQRASMDGVDPYAPFKGLLTYLEEQYPDAPQRARARSIMDVIEERRAPQDSVRMDTTIREGPPADSATIAVEDENASDGRETTGTDTLRSSPRSDSERRESASNDRREALPAPTAPRTGEDDVNRSETGQREWTLFVERFSEQRAASGQITALEGRLGNQWSVELLRDAESESDPYLLVVGSFESKQAAVEARDTIAERTGQSLDVQRRPETTGAPE